MGYTTKFKGKLFFVNTISADCLQKINKTLSEIKNVDLKLTGNLDGLEWDHSEKTYDLVEKVNAIILTVKKQFPEFALIGELLAQGEDVGDIWKLVIEDGVAIEKRIEL